MKIHRIQPIKEKKKKKKKDNNKWKGESIGSFFVIVKEKQTIIHRKNHPPFQETTTKKEKKCRKLKGLIDCVSKVENFGMTQKGPSFTMFLLAASSTGDEMV